MSARYAYDQTTAARLGRGGGIGELGRQIRSADRESFLRFMRDPDGNRAEPLSAPAERESFLRFLALVGRRPTAVLKRPGDRR